MKPYYEHAGITIYHGDCREVLPKLGRFRALITDPPYGVGLGIGNNQSNDCTHLHKAAYLTYSDTYQNFMDSVVPALAIALDASDTGCVFSGPHIHEQRKPVAIGGIYHRSATGRTPWGSKNFLPILFYGSPAGAGRHRPTVIEDTGGTEVNGHPVPKPLRWMKWLVGLASEEGDMVIDPFCGNAITLVAAKELNRRCIGIEIEERYCEIAAKRLSQEVFQF